jgi:3-dehydroquinate dehydratase/shikimate dehydrogenase
MSEPTPSAAVPPINPAKICVVIGRTRHKMMQAEIQEAAKRGVQFIELRLDFLARAPEFKRLLDGRPCPVIATVRRPADGGRYVGGEDERLTLLRQAIVAGFDWVDLETDIIDRVRRFKDTKRIVSYHNLREMPADLEQIYETMCKQDADLVKVAVCANAPADNLRVLDLLRNAPKPTVAFCTGEIGLPSRILGPWLGSPFAYAAFTRERSLAPGMPSLDELRSIYFFEQIGPQTSIWGVVGDPLAHSLSPLIHNKAFRQVGIDAVYLPFRVARSEFPDFLKAFDRLPVRGYSVTIPHKEMAATVAAQRDEAVTRIQAANTLVRGPQGWAAYNTDAQAAHDSLVANLQANADGTPMTLRERNVLLLGAGGVARAIAHMLAGQVAALTISNRSPDKAQQLADAVGAKTVDWEARHSVEADLVINCTSVGMQPNTDESPLHHSFLKPGLIVMDTVYSPETTLLVKEARARACHVITGVDMFVRQAALQFQLFTGKEPPLDFMRDVVRRALSPVAIREEGP